MNTKTRFGVALLAALVLSLAATSIVAARGGNAAAAHRCQMGGWMTLQGGSGQPFANQSECVSYAAGGGQLYGPTLIVTTVTGTGLYLGSYYFDYGFTGSGFHPNSQITLTVVYDALPYSDFNASYPAGFASNSSGSFTSTAWSQRCGVNAGDVVTGTMTLSDAAGVSASATFTGTCSS
jgi:uncharacterized protein YodC (DUF2158 family)